MYVPDEHALGNPGVFGFIKKAVSTVGKVLTGQTTVKLPTIPQPIVNIQAPVQTPQLPPWVLPAAIGLAAVFVLAPMLKGGRR